MKTAREAVKSAIEKFNSVEKVNVEVEMVDNNPCLQPTKLFIGYMFRSMLESICGKNNFMLSGSRLLDTNFWRSKEKDIDIFFKDEEAYNKAKSFISMLSSKRAVRFEPHWYYSYDMMLEIGRYEVFLNGKPIQVDLVLVEEFVSRDEAIAMSLLKNNRWETAYVGWNSWGDVLDEIKRQLV